MAPPKVATTTPSTTTTTSRGRARSSAKGKATAKTPQRAPKRKATDSDSEYVPAAATTAAAASASSARGKRAKRTSRAAAPSEAAVQQQQQQATAGSSSAAAGNSSSRAAAPSPAPPAPQAATPRRPSQRFYIPGRSFDSEIEEAEQALEPSPEQVEKENNTPELARAGRRRQEERESRRRTELADLGTMEYKLLSTVDQRGLEPFLPLSWRLDYPLRGDLYYGRDAADTHVNSLDFAGANANFRAMRALTELVRLGPAARDAFRHAGRRPEPFIAHRIKQYLAWANRDAGIDVTRAAPPILAIAAGGGASDSGDCNQAEVVATLERRMHRFAEQWHEWQTNALADRVSPPEPAAQTGVAAAPARGAHISDTSSEASSDGDEALFGPRGRAHRFFQTFCNVIERIVPARPAGFDDFYDSGADTDADAASQTSSSAPSPRTVTPPRGQSARDKGKAKEEAKELGVDAVYGIAVCHFVVAVLSYRLDNMGRGEQEARRARVIFYVDFAQADEDFWNAVAVAMAVCHCRDVAAANSDDMAMFAGEQDVEEDDDLDL